MYIIDPGSNRVRVVTADGKINTITGNGTRYFGTYSVPATSVGLPYPAGIAVGSDEKSYVSYDVFVGLLTPAPNPIFPLPSVASAHSADDFGGQSDLALGSWASIFGNYLASGSRSWADSDFKGVNAPTVLDSTSVTKGGQSVFVSYISPGQLNFQVPTNVGTGKQPMVVTSSLGKSAVFPVTVDSVGPGLLAPSSFQIKSISYVAATFSGGATYVLPNGAIAGLASRPAKAGDTIILYGVGFGFVSPSVTAGQVVQTSNSLVLPFQINIGSSPAPVTYAGLAPGTIGLYQFNVTVPTPTGRAGAASVTFTLGGVSSTQQVYIATQ